MTIRFTAALPMLCLASVLSAQATPAGGIPVPGQPYLRYGTTDSLGRSITYYLSEDAGRSELPLLVFIQGSGNRSQFIPNATVFRGSTGHSSLADAARGRARVLLVEKPGIAFGDDGTGGPSAAFRREHTLPRWSAAILAALHAAVRAARVDTTSITVIGHSEGGIAAARVAGTDPLVTRVVLVAGEGPTQLYSLIRLARNGDLLAASGPDPDARERALLAAWDSVLASPHDADRMFYGHAYPRWATFVGSSPLDELGGFRKPVLIVQGMADRAVDPTSAEVLFAALRARGRDATLWRIEGAGHSLRLAGGEDLWGETMKRIVDWSLSAAR